MEDLMEPQGVVQGTESDGTPPGNAAYKKLIEIVYNAGAYYLDHGGETLPLNHPDLPPEKVARFVKTQLKSTLPQK